MEEENKKEREKEEEERGREGTHDKLSSNPLNTVYAFPFFSCFYLQKSASQCHSRNPALSVSVGCGECTVQKQWQGHCSSYGCAPRVVLPSPCGRSIAQAGQNWAWVGPSQCWEWSAAGHLGPAAQWHAAVDHSSQRWARVRAGLGRTTWQWLPGHGQVYQ